MGLSHIQIILVNRYRETLSKKWRRSSHLDTNFLVKFVVLKVKVAQLWPTLGDPLDCNLSGFSVHGILQARILEWVIIPFSRVSSQSRDQTQVLPHSRQILYQLSHQGSPYRRVYRIWKFQPQKKPQKVRRQDSGAVLLKDKNW